MKNHTRQEAAARVAALRHNTGGTYAGAARFYAGFKAPSLSRWERKLSSPRTGNMEMLRAVTS